MTDADITRIIEDNADAKTFDLLAFSRSRQTVRDDFRVYFDENAMYHIAQWVDKNGEDKLDEAPEHIQALIARNLENSVLLHLVAPDPIETEENHKAIIAEFTTEVTTEVDGETITESVLDEEAAHTARGLDDFRFTLVSAEQPNGAKYEGLFTREEAEEFIRRLPAGESARLAKRLGEMVISAAVLSNRTDADFLPRA